MAKRQITVKSQRQQNDKPEAKKHTTKKTYPYATLVSLEPLRARLKSGTARKHNTLPQR